MNYSLIALLIILYLGDSNTLNYEIKNQNTGLTFVKLARARISYDSYTILYYIDISEYKNLTLTIENFLIQATHECDRLETSKTCKMLIEKSKTLISHMKRDELDIQAYQIKTNERKKSNRIHRRFGLMGIRLNECSQSQRIRPKNNKLTKRL